MDIFYHLGDNDKVLYTAICFAEKSEVCLTSSPEVVSPTRILKARKKLKELISDSICNTESIYNTRASPLTGFLRALSLLELIVTGKVATASSVYVEVISKLQTNPNIKGAQDLVRKLEHGNLSSSCLQYYGIEEAIYEDLLLLLYQDICRSNAYQRDHLRTTLESMMEKYPANTLSLSLYSWNERPFRIFNRVTRTLDTLANR